ncbi:hypothetical protein NST28_23245 [Paenibacillus sp. FSL R10-2791]|uniref:hypothetical protein n=1 Tax=Paenibacillus sp. FSL R10-2791 TaxID=2954695 RepID=UPI0030F8AE0A
MILYLTSEAHVNLIDFLEQEFPIKRLTGSFSLLSFVVKDMRNFSHARFVVLDRMAISESDEELIQALLSYQTIYGMRVVIIAEGLPASSPLVQQLIQIGIFEIVTASEIEQLHEELRQCFSNDGMQRFKPTVEAIEVVCKMHSQHYPEQTKYQFSCTNLKIAVAGSDRRVGTTITAMNLVCWINAHGGTACYVEANSNNHLAHIIHLFEPVKTGNAYKLEDNDLYMTEDLNENYNVIVMDCGVLGERIQESFSAADIRLLCGSAMPYDLARFYRAIERCNNLSVQSLGLFAPDDLKSYMLQTVDPSIIFGDPSHVLFNSFANNTLYLKLLEEQITNNGL